MISAFRNIFEDNVGKDLILKYGNLTFKQVNIYNIKYMYKFEFGPLVCKNDNC